MEIVVCECPVETCRYRWRNRVKNPKECPNCKHRFEAAWGLKLRCYKVIIKSREELQKLKADLEAWNSKGRWA